MASSNMNKHIFLLFFVLGSAVVPCFGEFGFNFDEKRQDTFWDDAVAVAVPPGDLKPYFQSLVAPKTVWTLSEGEYLMPYHMSLVPFNVSLQLQGLAVNRTQINFRGHQQVLLLAPGSYIEFTNMTVSGMTVGYFKSDTMDSTSANLYPRLGLFSTEFWAVTSDVQATSGGFLQTYFKVARQYGSLTTVGASTKLNETLTDGTSIIYPEEKGVFIFQTRNTEQGLGILHAYFQGVVQRDNPEGHEMEDLYNDMVTQAGPFSTSCWNATKYDTGFTFRGTVSTTVTGHECKRWDDPSTFPHNNFPAAPGKFSSVEKNYCRSPRFWAGGPWCYSSNPDIIRLQGSLAWELCDVPVCAGTNETLGEALPVGPTGTNNSVPLSPIIGAVAAGVVVIIILVIGLWYCCFRQPPVVVDKDAHADSALLEYDGHSPQVWHIKAPFESVLTCPFMKCGMEVKSATFDSVPGDTNLAPTDATTFKPQVIRMLKLCKSVDSLAKRDLEYKYGPSWVCDNDIDTGRLIGTGGIGKVYAGLHKGTPVAYKVINQMKTPDAMLRFVRKCVLPVVNVQLLSTFPSDHPHLLHLHDCIMFPQYSSLLLLAGVPEDMMSPETFLPGDAGHSISQSDRQQSVPLLKIGNGASSEDGYQAPEKLTAIKYQATSAPPLSSVLKPDWVSNAAAVELPDAQARARGEEYTPESNDYVASQSVMVSASESFSTESRRVGQQRSGKPFMPVTNATQPLQPIPSCSSHTSATVSDGEGIATRDIVTQIIMVSPLCELGTLTDILRCRTHIPVKALPEELLAQMHHMIGMPVDSVASLNVGDVQVTIDEDAPSMLPSVMPLTSVIAIKELPAIWQLIFKLQLSLQVLEGVAALHSVSLIHCDIKLDNVFITQNPAFAPFRVCAKVGDLDTCRSLLGAHLTNDSFGRIESMKVASDTESSDSVTFDTDPHTHFTSCLKGTPGFLAPEMISIGRVSSETDIFSLAVTISIMLSVRSQFYKLNDLHLKLVTDFYRELDEGLKNTLTDCLQIEPSRRPPLSVLKAHLVAQLERSVAIAHNTIGY